MADHNRNRSILPWWLAVVCCLCQGVLPPPAAAALELTVRQQRLSLSADGSPLAEILTGIAEQSGIAILYHGSPETPVRLTLTDIPIEQGLRKLLTGCSFSFIYEKRNSRSDIYLAKVIILPAQPDPAGEVSRFDPLPGSLPPEITPDSDAENKRQAVVPPGTKGSLVGDGVFVKASKASLRGLDKDAWKTLVNGRSVRLHLGFSGAPFKNTPEAAEFHGVQLSNVPSGSILEQLGMQTGDVVQDINGQRISRPEQLAAVLHEVLAGPGNGASRIEVERNDTIEPIYIELQ